MGCCSSTYAEGEKFNNTLNGYYGDSLQQQQRKRKGSKRSFSSRISSGSSSGVSSACTSPSRRSIFSRSQTNSPTTPSVSPTPKTRNFTLTEMPIKDIEMLSICDDFGERQQNNKSYGYYSESMSTGSGTSYNSPQCVRTQDTSGLGQESSEPEVCPPPSPQDLEMEMYMMYNSPSLMPKTSTPLLQRRDVAYDAVAVASPPSRSFQKWTNYLQNTPAYMLNNITRIPEAIAGHFSPLDHPGYTDLEDMVSAAKRFKADIHMMPQESWQQQQQQQEEDEIFYQQQIPLPSNVTHTISTDL